MYTRFLFALVAAIALVGFVDAQEKSDALPKGAAARLGNKSAIRTTSSLTGLQVLPDGKQIVTSDSKGISVWNLETGGLLSSRPVPVKKKAPGGISRASDRAWVNRANGALTLGADGKSVILSQGGPSETREFFKYLLPLDSSRTPTLLDDNTGPDALAAIVSLPGTGDLFSLSVRGRLDEVRGRTRKLEIPPVAGQVFRIATGGGIVAFSGEEKLIRVWDAVNKMEKDRVDTPSVVRALAVSADGKTLAVSSSASVSRLEANNGSVFVWSIPERKEIARWPDAARMLAVSSDGKFVAQVRASGRIDLFDGSTGKHIKDLGVPGADYQFMEFVKDDSMLVVGSSSGEVHVCDVATGKLRQEKTGHAAAVTGVHVLPNGELLTCGADGYIHIWDASGKELHKFLCEERGINALVVSEDGKTAFTAGGVLEPRVRAWNISKGDKIREYFQSQSSSLSATSLSINGKRLAVGFLGSGIHLLETESFKLLGRMQSHSGGPFLGSNPRDIVFAAGGRLIARDGPGYYIWDSTKLASVTLVETLTLQMGRDGGSQRISVSPDGVLFAAPYSTRPGKQMLGMWKTADGSHVDNFELTKAAAIYCSCWHPDGKTVAVGDADGKVWLVDTVLKGEPVALTGHQGPVHALAFSKDGRKLISGGSDTTAVIWNLP
jgi:WD40 repeat protein